MLLAILSVIRHHGIRCGALPSFTVDKNGRYRAASKGKEIRGTLNDKAAALLGDLGFNKSKPFGDLKVNSIQKAFERFCKRLYSEGKIKTVYSLHDLRHYAAVKHYTNDKDIIATQRYLGHASVGITQGYLATLDCEG
jgi:integrase